MLPWLLEKVGFLECNPVPTSDVQGSVHAGPTNATPCGLPCFLVTLSRHKPVLRTLGLIRWPQQVHFHSPPAWLLVAWFPFAVFHVQEKPTDYEHAFLARS